MVNLQELFDSLDVFRKLTGVRMQDIYNTTLRKGWTMGSSQLTRAMHGIIRLYHPRQLKLLERFWRTNPSDLVVSLIPNFNRALFQSVESTLAGVPFMTILTDLADFPPHFWIEKQRQYLVCGTERAITQARSMGYTDNLLFRSSGMILNPQFYEPVEIDREAERRKLGLEPDVPTGIVLFGGFGSSDMEDIAERLKESGQRVQLIMMCGHNAKLADRLRAIGPPPRMHVEGFSREVPYFMKLADFFIGKPGPGSISEALAMKLPMVVERNARTLPQERYNADWIHENNFGLVLSGFREVGSAIEELLAPENYRRLRESADCYQNRAVFEIPDFMAKVMARSV
jgi:1,2-diacylglycerol 3-beta-galactosyltransferase